MFFAAACFDSVIVCFVFFSLSLKAGVRGRSLQEDRGAAPRDGTGTRLKDTSAAVYHRGDGSTELAVCDPSASEGDGGATGVTASANDRPTDQPSQSTGSIRGNGRTNDCRGGFTPEGCHFPLFSLELSVPSPLVSGQISFIFSCIL